MNDVDFSSAERIKRARLLCGASRESIETKYKISQVTLRQWETRGSRKHGLSEKNAHKLVEVFFQEGVLCTKEWLLNGTGSGPSLISHKPLSDDWQEEESILKEVLAFQECNPSAIVQIMRDDSMFPFYSPSDYVGGIYNDKSEDFDLFLKRRCILETKEHGTLIRVLERDPNSPNKYVAYSTNPNTTAERPILYSLTLIKVAEIVWHRKRTLLKM